MLSKLLKIVSKNSEKFMPTPTLKEMGITQEIIDLVDKWAKSKTNYGKPAGYIPELLKYDIKNTALSIGDIHGNIITSGNAIDLKISIQSVIKPFLYLYALEKGNSPDEISSIEATSLQFNVDRVLQPNTEITRPGHPLNNAGAISSSGAIDDFDDFFKFHESINRF